MKAAIPKIQNSLPKGIRINVFYARTGLTQDCIKTVTNALLQGGVFVVLVSLFLFLAEFRTALVVLFSLPITFLVTFLIMGLTGLTANLMSLGGLAFSVGMVVDASIVIVENMRRHLTDRQDHSPRIQIAAEAVWEVARPVSFSILILAIVLVPLFTLQGIEGKMFIPLVTTMLDCTFVSGCRVLVERAVEVWPESVVRRLLTPILLLALLHNGPVRLIQARGWANVAHPYPRHGLPRDRPATGLGRGKCLEPLIGRAPTVSK